MHHHARDILKDSRGFMDTSNDSQMVQSDSGLTFQIMKVTQHISPMTGLKLNMEKEELPSDMPTPKGQPMCTITYADANLVHGLMTGRSMQAFYTSSIKHQYNGLQRSKAQWKLPLMDPSSWLPDKQLNKSWIFDIHYV